jgi:hypothetical protein
MSSVNNDATPPAQAAPAAKPVEKQTAITHGPAPTELFVDYADVEGVVHEGSGYACAPTYTTVDLLVGGTVTYGRLPIRTVLTQNALEIVYNGSNSSYALVITGQDGKEYPVRVTEEARPTMGVGSDKQHTMVVKLENVPGHQVTGVASCSHSR